MLHLLVQFGSLHVVSGIVFQNSGPYEFEKSNTSSSPPAEVRFARNYLKSIPEEYKNCNTYAVSRNDPSVPVVDCNPEECHTDCVCNHYGSSGNCKSVWPGIKERCRCNFYAEGYMAIPAQVCHGVRKGFFGDYRNSMLTGCNRLCRTDCICNHGGKDGVCGNFYSISYCRCVYYDSE